MQRNGAPSTPNCIWQRNGILSGLLLHSIWCNPVESFIYINVLSGWSFEVRNVAIVLAPILGLRLTHSSFLVSVNFVAKKNEGECENILRGSMLNETLLPSVQMSERIIIGDVIYKDTTICSSIKCITEWLELLLPCCVPNLQSNRAIVYNNFFLLEISSNCRFHVGICLLQ